MQDTTGMFQVVSTNPLVSTVVGSLIAAGIVAAIPPTRAASWRFIRWLGRGIKRFMLGAGNRIGRALITEKPPAVVASASAVVASASDKEREELRVELERWKAEVMANRLTLRYGEVLEQFEPLPLCFYRRYREWRDVILNVGNYVGTNLRYAKPYAEWRLQDDKWRQELWQKLASPNLIQVRSRIREYDQEHGELAALPVADTPYAGPRQSGPGLR